ncbi:MAG: HigA family addiction module antitoxin [Spirulinaceae cyanobacterium]
MRIITDHCITNNLENSRGSMMKDLQTILNGRTVRPAHPGEVLADVLDDIEMNPSQFAEILGVPKEIVDELLHGLQPVTVDLAIRMGQALGNGPQLWLNLQQKVDIWDALQAHAGDYLKVAKV